MQNYFNDTPEVLEHTQRIIDREIYCLDNQLVGELLSTEFFTYDDIQNAYDSNIDTIKEWLTQDADNDYITEQLEDYELEHGKNKLTIDNYQELLSNNELQEIAENLGFEPEPQAIFQWFRVSDWLAENLAKTGEPVLQNDYGNWWGRTCCGQAIELDGTIQEIARKLI